MHMVAALRRVLGEMLGRAMLPRPEHHATEASDGHADDEIEKTLKQPAAVRKKSRVRTFSQLDGFHWS